ncbi:alanine racemase [Pseudoalteromonas sp. OANN1]|uniref:alanine racemase n=1 Tax=Pseudoalteromonas sp. OANN1 TaxID=2954497 RepID=UPI002097540F|nr:alanine racemase [Pseudoalteromonas sp. OANN1]MCO7197531.1 alanine racemase [Pseudoalteromonas sp. OANN1]
MSDAFTAKLHPQTQSLLAEHQAKLFEWAAALGAPLHLVFPQRFAENIETLQANFITLGLEHEIYFAKKANKAQCFTQVASNHDIGIDVASVQEFELALSGGIQGEKIGVSGPHKSDALLSLALVHQALIAIDSSAELNSVITLARQRKRPARVLLRLQTQPTKASRFGSSLCQLTPLLAQCREYKEWVSLEGFSCHLSGYCPQARGESIHTLVGAIDEARQIGLSPSKVNIGGGLPVSYLQNEQWQQALDFECFFAGKTFAGFYPYHNEQSPADTLHAILAVKNTHGQTALAALRQRSLTLMLEPGRALLDEAGISLFKVQGTKPHLGTSDCHIATLSGSSLSLSEQWFESEYLPSPLLLTAHSNRKQGAYRVAFGGATCLDSDMLSWRFIPLSQLPQRDDLMVYLNTAGYQMDSNESEFHSMPLPRKIAVTWENNRLSWQLLS